MEINKVELWQCANFLETEMRKLGIAQIRYSTDQTALTDAAASMEKGSLGENFKKSLHTFPPNKFMWIGSEDANGNFASIVAARLDDIGTWSLQKFIHEHFARVIDARGGGHVTLKKDSCAFANNIFGRCVYIGEGYAAKEWRGTGLSALMLKYLMLIVWDEWKPEIAYAWIRRRQMETGKAVDWGFTETYETPLQFEAPPLDPDWTDTFFVGLRQIGIHQMIQTIKTGAEKAASNNIPEDLIPPLF